MGMLDAYKHGGRDDIHDIVRTVGGALWKTVKFVRWPLPNRPAYRTGVVLALALAPLLPIDLVGEGRMRWILAHLAIALAILVAGDRIIASLEIARVGRLSIRAKQFGLEEEVSAELEKELGNTSWSGLPLLVFTLAGVACTVIIAISSVTWSLINHLGYLGPFQTQAPQRHDVFLYFTDEAARGFTFRLLSDLGIAVPDKLQVVESLWFTLLMWAYKASLTLLTIQVGWLWIISMFTERDPEIRRLFNVINNLSENSMDLERKNIFANQHRNQGRLTRVDRKALRLQRGYHRNDREVMEQIQRAFRWHNEVTGRLLKREEREELERI